MNIFIDGSYSHQKKIGVGAYIIITSENLTTLSDLSIAELKTKLSKDIVYKVFNDTKGSTDVEQRIFELALLDKKLNKEKITVYTDCQKTSKSTNTAYDVIHVKGHTKQSNRINTDKIFDVVDKAARKRLRKIVKEYN